MPGLQRSAKNSRVRVAGTVLNFANWSAEWAGDDLDTTNFESFGLEEGLIGIEVVNFNGGGHWDAGRNPYETPPGIFPRSNGGPVELIENTADNNGWLFNVVRFLSTRNSAELRGVVSFEFTGKSNGAFNRPAGSV